MTYSNKDILRITYPVLFSMLVEQFLTIIDNAFLGRLSEIELGASAIGGVFAIFLFMASFGFALGSQIIIGRRNGEKNYHRIGNIFYQGIYFQIVLAVIVISFTLLCVPNILPHILSSQQICTAAVSYLNWRTFGLLFGGIATMYRSFFMGTVQTKALMPSSIIMVASNCIFNYILIFGKFGFPQLGITGAAIGTSLAELVQLLYYIVYTRYKIDIKKYRLNIIPRIDLSVLKQVWSLSIWTMIQNICSIGTWFLFYLFIEHLGEKEIAVTNIIRGMNGIIFVSFTSFAATCCTLVSNLLGMGKSEEVIPTIRRHIKLAYLCVMPIILIYVLFPNAIFSIFTNIEELKTLGIPVMWVLLLINVIGIAQSILFESVAGTGNTKAVLQMEIVSLAIYTLFIWYVIYYLKSSLVICWTADAVYYFVMLILSLWFFKYYNWKEKKI